MMDNKTHCAGCGQSFEGYGMTRAEGFELDGLVYCNSDCEMESNRDRQDAEELAELGRDY